MQPMGFTDDQSSSRQGSIKTVKGGLLKDAYSWILAVLISNDGAVSNSQLVWIKGDHGMGKTMLLCGIINKLTRSALTPLPSIFLFAKPPTYGFLYSN
jgi:hypothetical protein